MNLSSLTRRALDEIPYHLSRLDFSETQVRWIEIWSDPGWLLTKLATSGVTQVMEDFALTPESCRPEHFQQWMSLLAPAIDYDYRQVTSQLIGRGAPQTGIFEKLCRNPLVASLLPSQDLAPSDSSEKDICISAIYRLNSGERHHAAALSAVRDELSLWNFKTGQCDKGKNSCHTNGVRDRVIKNDLFFYFYPQCLETCSTSLWKSPRWPTTVVSYCAGVNCVFMTWILAKKCSSSKVCLFFDRFVCLFLPCTTFFKKI